MADLTSATETSSFVQATSLAVATHGDLETDSWGDALRQDGRCGLYCASPLASLDYEMESCHYNAD